MKRISALLLAMTMLVGMLAACGGNTSSQQPAGETPAASTPAEGTGEGNEAGPADDVDPASYSGKLEYWSYNDKVSFRIEEFNKIYPNIEIDYTTFGGDDYKTLLQTSFMDNALPDLFDLEEGYAYQYIDSDLIENLSARGGYDTAMEGFYPFMLDNARASDGSLKGVTYQSSPVVFWYTRDAAKQWLGTDDATEISKMLNSWDAILEKSQEVYEASNGEVYLWPNISEMPKIVALDYTPFVRDMVFNIPEEWNELIDAMRAFHESPYVGDYGSWGEEWAAKWNAGELIIRVMPSWDFFVDQENYDNGNVGVAAPFSSGYEGCTITSMASTSENKELADLFLKFLVSDEFQMANLEKENQVPGSHTFIESLGDDFASPNFGGQNILEVYDQVNMNTAAFIPDSYTRPAINEFQGRASDGIKNGATNEEIMEDFVKIMKDKYPELDYGSY